MIVNSGERAPAALIETFVPARRPTCVYVYLYTHAPTLVRNLSCTVARLFSLSRGCLTFLPAVLFSLVNAIDTQSKRLRRFHIAYSCVNENRAAVNDNLLSRSRGTYHVRKRKRNTVFLKLRYIRRDDNNRSQFDGRVF